MKILVINSGSSSLKYKLFEMETSVVLCSGVVERIGQSVSELIHKLNPDTEQEQVVQVCRPFENHNRAIEKVASLLMDEQAGLIKNSNDLFAIGHRVAQGGETFKENCLIDDTVIAGIEKTSVLAPLHNPANLAGIKATMAMFPTVPSMAVFDTQFSKDLEDYAYRYSVPEKFYTDHKVRRYGFHGTSHRYVTRQLGGLMQTSATDLNNIVCHLGNGSSMTAVKGGICVDTSMGMTPMAGIMMGTRCGDIDPSIHGYLAEQTGKPITEINEILNRESGLFGICGMNDMRDIHGAIEDGDDRARLAFEMLCYGIKKYIGAYHAVLGRLDAIAFTAGIGENDAAVRMKCLEGLSPMGIVIDPSANGAKQSWPRKISSPESRIQVWVVPTNEELEIAQACQNICANS